MSKITTPNSEVILSVTGPIERGPSLFHYGKNKERAASKFSVPVYVVSKGRGKNMWFPFIAFDHLAEFIALNYTRSSIITVVKATPTEDTEMHKGYPRRYTRWIVEEIAQPISSGPRNRDSGTLTEIDLERR